MGHKGEVRVDQAHRGYTAATDEAGFASCNPLFMKYTPNHNMEFAGQSGYGYRSVEAFVQAVLDIRKGKATPPDFDGQLATLSSTFQTTAILEAGRRSLDAGGHPMHIVYHDGARGVGTAEGAAAAGASVPSLSHVPMDIRKAAAPE